jgi:hypothetical protein
MTNKSRRAFTDFERKVLDRLLEGNFQGKEEIRQQLLNATAKLIEGTNDNYGSINIHTSSDHRADVKDRVPVMGTTRDEGGGPVEILLHVVDGLVKELEFVRVDGQQMDGLPQLNMLKLHILDGSNDEQQIKID